MVTKAELRKQIKTAAALLTGNLPKAGLNKLRHVELQIELLHYQKRLETARANAGAYEQRAAKRGLRYDEETETWVNIVTPEVVSNVQVDIVDYETGNALALDTQYAMAILKDAGVPIRNMPVTDSFEGSYLVNLDAVWYAELGSGGSFDHEGTYAGYHYLVSVAHEG